MKIIAETEDDLKKTQEQKRVRKAEINASEYEAEEEHDGLAFTQKQKSKQALHMVVKFFILTEYNPV